MQTGLRAQQESAQDVPTQGTDLAMVLLRTASTLFSITQAASGDIATTSAPAVITILLELDDVASALDAAVSSTSHSMIGDRPDEPMPGGRRRQSHSQDLRARRLRCAPMPHRRQ